MFSAAGYFFHPGVQEPNYESVSRYLATTTNPDDPIYVWGSVPEIYWASERRPATRFLTSSFLTGNYPGRPPADANTGAGRKDADDSDDDRPDCWVDFGNRFFVRVSLRLACGDALRNLHGLGVRNQHPAVDRLRILREGRQRDERREKERLHLGCSLRAATAATGESTFAAAALPAA